MVNTKFTRYFKSDLLTTLAIYTLNEVINVMNKDFNKNNKLNIINMMLNRNNVDSVRSDDLEFFYNAIEQHKLNRSEVELMIKEFGLSVVRSALRYQAYRLVDTSLYTICEDIEQDERVARLDKCPNFEIGNFN